MEEMKGPVIAGYKKIKGEKSMGKSKRLLSVILCIMLIVAMALITTGCSGSKKEEAPAAGTKADGQEAGGEMGEGSKTFPLTVVDKDGNQTEFVIHTEKETVGEALEELGLIAGDEGEFGIYVKTVNGITADYDTDGVYWAFYINGEYASTSVDSTMITEGDSYSFQVE